MPSYLQTLAVLYEEAFERLLVAVARREWRLLEVPGIGPQTATALVATIDSGSAFGQGRDFAV